MDWIKLFDTDLAIKHYCKAPFSMRKRGFKERGGRYTQRTLFTVRIST